MERLREVIDRKVRIRVVTNGVGATDEPLVHWRYARYRLKMLKMGIELYEVSPTLARDVERVRHLRPDVPPAARQGGGVRQPAAVRRLDELRPALGLVEHRVGPADREPGDGPPGPQPDRRSSTTPASTACASPPTARRSSGGRGGPTATCASPPRSPTSPGRCRCSRSCSSRWWPRSCSDARARAR